MIERSVGLPARGMFELNQRQAEQGSGVYALSSERRVTLIVYDWSGVEPGTLAWSFPSVSAALGAASALRNALRWEVVDGALPEGDGSSKPRVLASST